MIAIVNERAQTVARYSYDAWGTVTNVETYTESTDDVDIATINPFRYRSYYFDQEIGLYYLQSRYYDAGVGRFVNVDSTDVIGTSDQAYNHNLFSYCTNNPVNNEDHYGDWVQFAVGAVIGGLLNLLFYWLDCLMAGTKMVWWRALLNFLNGAVNGVIAASGAGLTTQIIAGIGSALAGLLISGGSPDAADFVIAIICGVLSGLLGGTLSKGNNKHINYLIKKFGKKIAKSTLKSSLWKNLINGLAYVIKNSRKIIFEFIKNYCIPNATINLISKAKTVVYNMKAAVV